MRSLILRLISFLVLLICVVCPLIEMFDRWDHTLQSGSDTEYTFMVVALCIGVLYSFVRTLYRFSLLNSVAKALAGAVTDSTSALTRALSSSLIRIPISPPIVALRI
jgi:hypothetical protein